MHKLALTTVLTSQGVAFLHAGTELLRTKQGVENSYESPDAINRIDWSRKGRYAGTYEYVRALIRLRKNHPAFRMTSTEQIRRHLNFLDIDDELLVAYTLSDHPNGDAWEEILVVLNGNREERSLDLPAGEWTLVLDGDRINEEGLEQLEGAVTVPASSAMVLVGSSKQES